MDVRYMHIIAFYIIYIYHFLVEVVLKNIKEYRAGRYIDTVSVQIQ